MLAVCISESHDLVGCFVFQPVLINKSCMFIAFTKISLKTNLLLEMQFFTLFFSFCVAQLQILALMCSPPMAARSLTAQASSRCQA